MRHQSHREDSGRLFGLPPSAFRFHNEMSSQDLPGLGDPAVDVLDAVTAAHGQLASERGAAHRRDARGRHGAARDRRSAAAAPQRRHEKRRRRADRNRAARARHDAAAGRDLRRQRRRLRTSRAGDTSQFTPDDVALLRRHVINLRMGALRAEATFQTTEDDVRALFAEHLPASSPSAVSRRRRCRSSWCSSRTAA